MTVLRSAGLLIWRPTPQGPEFLLAHPGGPYWRNRDAGAWTIPKGAIDPDENPLAAARREFFEETGLLVGEAVMAPLKPLKQPSGKVIEAWLAEADLDVRRFASNLFEMEWPRHSGLTQRFPEIDRIAYFEAEVAAAKILPGQRPFLDQALALIG